MFGSKINAEEVILKKAYFSNCVNTVNKSILITIYLGIMGKSALLRRNMSEETR